MKVRAAWHLLLVAASAHASKVAAENDDDDGGGAVAWITDSETVVVGNHTERVLHKHRLNVSTHNHDSRAAEEEADDDHNTRGREGGQVFSVIDLIHEKQRQQVRGRDARANSMRAMLEEIQMEQQQQIRQQQEMIVRASEAPNTWMGGVVVPLLLLMLCCRCCMSPDAGRRLDHDVVTLIAEDSPVGRWSRAVQRMAKRRGWSLHDVTRVCVCLYFLHEGVAVFQVKETQYEEGQKGVWTPFGQMRAIPSWEKGDAMDMILLFTALSTLLNLLPDIGLVLLLVDVATDALDLLVRMWLNSLTGAPFHIDELTAKKLSLLGVMALVATHRWREERAILLARGARGGGGGGAASAGSGAGDAAAALEGGSGGGGGGGVGLSDVALPEALPGLLILIGRIMIAVVFFHAAAGELLRLLVPMSVADINPDDPHNIIWPKLVEVTLALPFVLGYQTVLTSRLLTATLFIEALTCWPFWAWPQLGMRIHCREHFTVNVAVAGGLLLVQEVGGGKYAIDAVLKRD